MFTHMYKIIRHSFSILITNPAAVELISIHIGVIHFSTLNTERHRNLILLHCCSLTACSTVFSLSLQSY